MLEGLGDWAGETLGGESQTPGRVRTELADAASALASGASPGLSRGELSRLATAAEQMDVAVPGNLRQHLARTSSYGESLLQRQEAITERVVAGDPGAVGELNDTIHEARANGLGFEDSAYTQTLREKISDAAQRGDRGAFNTYLAEARAHNPQALLRADLNLRSPAEAAARDGESWRLGGLDDFVDGWRNGAARAHRFGVVMDYLSGQHPEMIPPIEPRAFDEHTVTGRIGQTIAGVGADLATLPFIPGHERIKASREDSAIDPNTAYWLGMADMAGTVLPPAWSAGTAALTESGRALADREADVSLADAALRGLQAGALSLAFDRVTDGLSDGLSGLGGGSGNGGLFGDLLPEPVGVRILDNPVDGPQGLRGPTTPPDEPLGQNVFASWWGGKKIEEGRQGKHQPDHNNFMPGRSELTHPDPQELLDKHAGTGQQAGRETVGEPGSKERVDFGEPIGKHVDQHTGEKNETTVGMIHYSKKGAHIVPARPSSSD